MNLLTKTLKAIFAIAIIFSFGTFYGCDDGEPKENKEEPTEIVEGACQDTGGSARANCNGPCPSEASPNCYVRFRKAGSSNAWEKSGQSSMDRTDGVEYACYCDK
jgi:hypothetical protein